MNYVRVSVGSSLQYLITSIDILGSEKGKVSFDLKYIWLLN